MQVFNEYKKIIPFYCKELKRIFLMTSILFFIVLIITSLYLYNNPHYTQQLLTSIKEVLLSKDLLTDTGTIRVGSLIANNLFASFTSIAIGSIPFLFLPFLSLLINAGVIGVVFGSMPVTQFSIFFIISSILPHGIFEITALLLSLSLGLYLCKELCRCIIGSKRTYSLFSICIHILRIYILIIVPLMILAGFIETYITPLIMNALQ